MGSVGHLCKAIGSRDADVGRAAVEMKPRSVFPAPGAASGPGFPAIEQNGDPAAHVGIVVDELVAATDVLRRARTGAAGHGSVEGRPLDRVAELEGVRTDVPSCRPGRPPTSRVDQIPLVLEDIDTVAAGLLARGAELVGELGRYEDSHRLCCVRGPEGIIVEPAEQIG
jgi:hypothetical protein